MFLILLAALIGLLPAAIAHSKGRSFAEWWLYGSALFIVALPHAIILQPNMTAMEERALRTGENKRCIHCAEVIKVEAKVCRYCGHKLPAHTIPETYAITRDDGLVFKGYRTLEEATPGIFKCITLRGETDYFAAREVTLIEDGSGRDVTNSFVQDADQADA